MSLWGRLWPNFVLQVSCVWLRNLTEFKRNWYPSLFWMLWEPAIILGAIGLGLGSFIVQVQGHPYFEFFFPGFLCVSSMMVAFFESTYGSFSKMNHSRIYSSLLLAPLQIQNLVLGEALWAATKGTLTAACLSLLAFPFGVWDRIWILPALLIIFICSLLFAAFGLVVTSWIRNHDSITFATSGVMVPMAFLCGAYFPLDFFPKWIRQALQILPTTEEVSLVRAVRAGGFENWDLARAGYILVLLALFLSLANANFRKRLLD